MAADFQFELSKSLYSRNDIFMSLRDDKLLKNPRHAVIFHRYPTYSKRNELTTIYSNSYLKLRGSL